MDSRGLRRERFGITVREGKDRTLTVFSSFRVRREEEWLKFGDHGDVASHTGCAEVGFGSDGFVHATAFPTHLLPLVQKDPGLKTQL